jgi:hypothetical protein
LDVIVWLDLADEILTTTTSQRIDRAYLATWEADNRVLRTEGDVVDASSCQLFNPVNLALTSFYRHENVVMLNEHNATVDGADNRSRVDRAWTLEGDWEHPFAVLEAKRSGTILPQQYERAIQEGFHHRASGEPIQSRETTFLENSYELMAQAARYSVKYYTPYVALFDWDHLVLAVMEQASGTNGGTYCWLTVVSERRLMRRALLGFLHGAYKEVVSRDRFLPPPVHFAVKELPARKKAKPASQRTSRSGRESYRPERYGDSEYTSSTPRGSTRYAYEDDFGMEKLSLRDNRHDDRQRKYLHEGEYYSTGHRERSRDRRLVAPDFKPRASSSSSKSSKSGPFGLGPDGLKGHYGSSSYYDYK